MGGRGSGANHPNHPQLYTIQYFAEIIGMNNVYFARRYVRPIQKMIRQKEKKPIYISDL